MKKPISCLLNVILLFYSKPALCASVRYAVCEDSSTFEIVHGDEKKSCKWLQTQQAQTREELCKDIGVRTHCSHSCGSCCWDDKTFRFKMESGRLRSCFWLSKSSNRILKYCSSDEHVRQRCRKSCGICRLTTKSSHLTLQGSEYSNALDEIESSSMMQSTVPIKNLQTNDLIQSSNEDNKYDEGKEPDYGLFAILISMIFFSFIFGAFFSKRTERGVVTFRNVIINKEETEKVSVILKTLWEAKAKPQY